MKMVTYEEHREPRDCIEGVHGDIQKQIDQNIFSNMYIGSVRNVICTKLMLYFGGWLGLPSVIWVQCQYYLHHSSIGAQEIRIL